jgi:predicted neuraminidase
MRKKINLIFLSGLVALFLTGAGHSLSDGNEPYKKTVLKLESGTNNPRNSEGDFITLKDGRTLFIFSRFTGTDGGDFGHAYLASRYSTDKGKTWSNEDRLVVTQEAKVNTMSVSLLRLKNGSIALFYLRVNSTSDCIPWMRISTDEAKTWSEPVQCISDRKGYFVVNNNRVIQLKNGRLLMPAAYHYVPEGGDWNEKAGHGRIFCYYSDDNGQTWKPSKEVPNPDGVLNQEPAVIELKNGDILMLIRTNSGAQYISNSKDKGKTWGAAKKSNIISPTSPASVARIPSTGDLLLVWNNTVNEKRTPLNIAVSKNEGKTWSHIKTLEGNPDKGYCYTAIHFTDDKDVLLGYCAGSQSKGILNETDIVKLNLEWIYK